jgi:DNA-binding PadR family transcriptional regulator
MKDAELAILSIIAEAPITGIDVQEVIAARNLRMWTMIGVESVYYLIEKLTDQGLVENIDEHPPEDKRLRLYRITPAGIGILQTAITDLLASPRQLPDRFDIGLANLPVLSSPQAENALTSYRAGLQSRHDALQNQIQILKERNLPFHILSMFEHQIALLQAEMTWFDDWFEAWKTQLPPQEIPPEREPETYPRMQQVVLPIDPDSFHKQTTREHPSVPEDDEVEFPPPPEKRPPADQTRLSQKTPPRVFDDD